MPFDKQYGYSAICKDTDDKQQQYDIANKSYTDALNTYNKAKLDGSFMLIPPKLSKSL